MYLNWFTLAENYFPPSIAEEVKSVEPDEAQVADATFFVRALSKFTLDRSVEIDSATLEKYKVLVFLELICLCFL